MRSPKSPKVEDWQVEDWQVEDWQVEDWQVEDWSGKSKQGALLKPMEKTGPSAAKLKKLAKTHQPPQRWFDETAHPFVKDRCANAKLVDWREAVARIRKRLKSRGAR